MNETVKLAFAWVKNSKGKEHAVTSMLSFSYNIFKRLLSKGH